MNDQYSSPSIRHTSWQMSKLVQPYEGHFGNIYENENVSVFCYHNFILWASPQ